MSTHDEQPENKPTKYFSFDVSFPGSPKVHPFFRDKERVFGDGYSQGWRAYFCGLTYNELGKNLPDTDPETGNPYPTPKRSALNPWRPLLPRQLILRHGETWNAQAVQEQIDRTGYFLFYAWGFVWKTGDMLIHAFKEPRLWTRTLPYPDGAKFNHTIQRIGFSVRRDGTNLPPSPQGWTYWKAIASDESLQAKYDLTKCAIALDEKGFHVAEVIVDSKYTRPYDRNIDRLTSNTDNPEDWDDARRLEQELRRQK
jgi:hypothetical protein